MPLTFSPSRRAPVVLRRLAVAALMVPVALAGAFAQSAPEKPVAEAAKPAAEAPAAPRPARAPAPVVVVPVAVRAMPAVVDLVGTAQSIASIPIKTRVDSQIDAVLVAEGDRVEVGQVLLRLDARAILAQVAQAGAVLARDEAQLALLLSDLERTDQLVQTRTKSSRDLESAKTLVTAQQATIEADRAALRNLEVQASWYEIKSPIRGRVGSLPFKAGSVIRAADGTLLGTVNQIDPIYVAVSVPQAVVPALREAMTRGDVPVIVTRPGAGGPKLQGRVAFIENALDVASGTLGVKAMVANADESLLPGEFVQVRVALRSEPTARVVPETAIQLGQNGTFVYVVKPGDTVEVRRVGVDRTVDGQSVIASGLEAGERVVVDGQLRLFPGAAVVPTPAAASAERPATAKAGG